MKKIKLFLAAVAAMVTMGVNAQGWTAQAPADGDFYLFNVGTGKFLSCGEAWGTQAVVGNGALNFTLANNGSGAYTLYTTSTFSYGNPNSAQLQSSGYVDQSVAATTWTFTEVTGQPNTYTMQNAAGTYMVAPSNGAILVSMSETAPADAYGYWKLINKANLFPATASESNPVDVTCLIGDASFESSKTAELGWTITASNQNLCGGDSPNKCAESYRSTFYLSQTITNVPNGLYGLKAQGFYRKDQGNSQVLPRFFINGASANFPLKTGDEGSMSAASASFTNGNYTIDEIKVWVVDGKITLGAENHNNNYWCIWDNFQLTYYGAPVTGDEVAKMYIKNPVPTEEGTGWTIQNAASEDAIPNAYDGANNCAEFWSQQGFSIKQTLTDMPAGYYQLTAVALQRDNRIGTVSVNDATATIAYCGSVNDRGGANTWFNDGNGVNTVTYHLTSNGSVTVGLTADNVNSDYWTVWRSFELNYLGEYPVSVTSQFLEDAVAEAQGLYASLPTAAQAALQAVVDAKNISYSTGKEYSDAAEDVIAAIAVARPFIDPYARFLAVKPNVVALKNQTTKYTDPGTAVSTFDAAVAAQQTAVDEATTVAAIETAIVNLRKAASAFAGNVDIVAGQYLDMTDAMLYNASMRNSGDLSLWTIVSNTNTDYPKYANNCSEFWQANFDFYQTAYELPAGNYNIEVSAFHRAAQEESTYHTYLYANSDQVLVLPLANGENNTAQAEASFNNGLYTNSIKITLDDATDVNIGFKNEDTDEDLRESGAATDKWTIFRDFKIKYFGDDALALYRDEYEGALTAATEALADATYTNVAGTDRSNLSTAVNTTYPTSVVEVDETQEKFETATSNLTALTTTFKNGVASWNNYANTRAGVAAAKDEADLFDEDIYTGLSLTEPTTAAEAAAKAAGDEPAIRVATYNYVNTNYTYSLTGKIGDFSTWTPTATVNGEPATAQTLDGEHWSNITRTYYEQADNGWGSNAWTVQYQKVANNLPAGNYVLKLAARGSVDTHGTIASSATANTVTLPSAGNNTRGINTAGVASWSNSDTFRRSAQSGNNQTEDNKGAGWQWRFLPFTVSEAGDVTLTIEAHTDLIYNWVSLADAELLSDEDKTTKITLSDASDMASTITSNDGELATVTLQRGIKVGYNTVVLPFDLTAVQVQAVFGSGAVVYSYSENSANTNSIELTFTTVGSGAITANVPVLVKATAAATEKVIEGVTIEAPTTTIAEGTNFDYVGVYDLTTFAAGDFFLATKDNVQQIFQSEGINDTAKPFRAYFQKKVAGNVKATLFIDGVATAIEGISADVNNDNDATIFNLAGQRVNKAQKGIYIVNGKKVAVK